MTDILSSKKITLKTSNLSGGPITSTEWKIDDVVQSNITDTLVIQPNQLTLGEHTIKFRSQNYCGNYSVEKIETLNIIEESNMAYSQEDSININQPTMNVSITLKRTSTITVTVKDENQLPITAALVSIAGISGETNAEGIVVLQSVPYGTHIMITTVN